MLGFVPSFHPQPLAHQRARGVNDYLLLMNDPLGVGYQADPTKTLE